MRRWLVATLVRLYPRVWRQRYGEEYRALLDQHPLTLRDVLDSARGAWDAHLREYREGTTMPPLSRSAVLVVFGAWLGFMVAGMELYAVVDDSPFVPAMQAHPPFSLAWLALAGGAALSLAAVVVGGAPIALGVVRHAFTQRRGLLHLLAVPVVAVAFCLGYALWMAAIAYAWIPVPTIFGPITTAATYDPTAPESHGNFVIAVCGLVLVAGSVVASGAAVIALIARSEVSTVRFRAVGIPFVVQPYRFARLLARTLALAMLLSFIAAGTWGLFARVDTPDAFAENGETWLVVTLTMAATTALAAVAAYRDGAKHLPPTPVS